MAHCQLSGIDSDSCRGACIYIQAKYRKDTDRILADTFMYVCVCIFPKNTYKIHAGYRHSTVNREKNEYTFMQIQTHSVMYVLHTDMEYIHVFKWYASGQVGRP